MSNTYGNDAYPHSRRIHSRPYMYNQHLVDNTGLKAINELFNALHSLGEDAIGLPFNACCDMDKYPPPHFSPAFWDENTIADEIETQDAYKKFLSEDAQDALDNLIKIINKNRAYPANGSRNGQTVVTFGNPYKDGQEEVLSAIRTLWEHEIMLDARISHAERLFFYNAQDASKSHEYPDHGNGKDRLKATLEWMAEPENADRIGLMFLHSRLAQHYGELDRESFQFANHVHEELKHKDAEDIANQLKRNPERYFEDVINPLERRSTSLTLAEEPPPKKKNILTFITRNFSSAIEPESSTINILNKDSLIATTDTVISDHARLKDGSWAKEQLSILFPEMLPALKQPQLSDYS